VYSLGAVLYELLTGRLPAKPEEADRLTLDAYQPWLECKERGPEAVRDGEVDARLAAIVLKCLAFDPAARYASAAELAEELRGYLGSVARPALRVKHHRRAMVLAAIGATAGIGLIGSFGLGTYLTKQKQPAELELLYRQGLDEYEQQKYEDAVITFTKCLERKSGWPDALFGRAQALRQLEKWREARTDYTALREADAAWSYALAGYCSMRVRDDSAAVEDFRNAHRHGLRDVGYLLNYARALRNRQLHSDAVRIFAEVLAADPQNRIAIRDRGLAHVAIVANDKTKIPSTEAFEDAEKLCQLDPKSFDAAYCAAIIFGEAARKDSNFDPRAVGYLTDALNNGLPVEAVNHYPRQLKRLMPSVEEGVIAGARHDSRYRVAFVPIQEFPDGANWEVFQERYSDGSRRLAQNH
jgi:tetratricopeptide (TPR) repeat protein